MSATQTVRINANRGSDIDFWFIWRDTSGDPVDLFDYTVSKMETTAAINSYVTLTISDPANGRIDGRIEWNDLLQSGVSYYIRIQVTDGDDTEDQATNLIEVTYQ